MRYAVISLVLVLFLLSAVFLQLAPAEAVGLQLVTGEQQAQTEQTENNKLFVTFSHTQHFYSESIEVGITASSPGAVIYYSTDGTVPASTQYTGPLSFPAGSTITAVTLKAVAVYDGVTTKPVTHTYFIGKGVDRRFNTLVFSLTAEPGDLYDYETGILVAGQTRDEYIKEHPYEFINPPAPANYNWRGMEGERPVYVEVFTPQGERVVAQAAGVRVSGGWSRANDQKSLRLIARKEYEPSAGKFHYDFFENDTKNDAYGTPLTEYDTIVLRNGANDREFGMLRNEAASLLALDAGFYDVSPVRAAAVFLNGEYYGFAWLQVSLNEQYLEDVYNAPERSFDIVGDGEQWYNSENTAAVESLETVYSYASKNLRDDAVFAELESMVDIDNLLLYYAFEIYMGNEDWPHNNMKRWRYTGEHIEGLAPELDGRWRYLMYDLDWVLGLYGDNAQKQSFQDVLEGSEKRSPLLAAILTRSDMAEKFSYILCSLAGNTITRGTVEQAINTLYKEAEQELAYAFAARKYSGWVSAFTVADNHNNMVSFAQDRGAYIINSLRSYFRYGSDMFTVRVTGGEAIIGTQKGTSAQFFCELTVPVSPVLPRQTAFDHWLVNGRAVYEEELFISEADAVDGIVGIELVTKDAVPPLVISEAYASSLRNGCVLSNFTDAAVSTGGLYMSNDAQNLFKWALPAATVAPGESLVLAGKGSTEKNDLLKIQMGFNVRQGQVLILSDESGAVLDYLAAGDG